MHLSSVNVIPANETRESIFGHRNFPRHEQGSNLGPQHQRQVPNHCQLPRFLHVCHKTEWHELFIKISLCVHEYYFNKNVLMIMMIMKVYDGLLLYRGTYLLTGQGKHIKLTSEFYSTLVDL